MTSTPHRFLFALVCFALARVAGLADDRAEEIVRIHIAAIGGEQRVAAVSSFRAGGKVRTDGQTIAFTMAAARPNRLRMEYTYDDGTLVQATDGTNPPWETDSRAHPAINRLMSSTAALQFVAEAEFDDPLVAGAKRGYTVEDAGETTVKGHRLLRLLITHHLAQSYFLLLDPATYYIVLRVDPPPAAGPEHAEIVTEYRDFRPVGGVLVPHAVVVWKNGQISEDAKLDRIEPNPALGADAFSRPSAPKR